MLVYMAVIHTFINWTWGRSRGSALWSILYALVVSSLLDHAKITLFVDDNYILECNKHKEQLTVKMEEKLEIITNWFRDSVMKDIVSKMEMCLFHWKDQPPSNLYLMAKSSTTTQKTDTGNQTPTMQKKTLIICVRTTSQILHI